MMNEEFSDDVLKLRPRKLRLSRDVERLLEDVCEAEQYPVRTSKKSRLRPCADSINAIRCADCGQIEYISRDYCRCGHYLAGQVMDEFLAWEHDLVETHDRLAAETEEKLKLVRWASLAALPFFVWIFFQALLGGGQNPTTTYPWILPGMAILGLCALIEKFISVKRDASACAVETASFEQFLTERSQRTYDTKN